MSLKLEEDEYPNQVPENVVVSVRMTTYNHADFIREAIEGVLNQKTNFLFELCIGEDDSTDGTREICLEYARKYPNLIRLFLRSDKNKIYINGKKTGRYNGLKTRQACRGSYLAFLEGDDYWTSPNKLQVAHDFLQENPAFIGTYHNVEIKRTGPLSEESLQELWFTNSISAIQKVEPRNFIYGVCMNLSSVVIRNDGNFPERKKSTLSGDLFTFMLLSKKGPFHYIDECMGVYRKHGGGMYSGLSSKERNQLHFSNLQLLEELLPESCKSELRVFALYRALKSKALSQIISWLFKLVIHPMDWFKCVQLVRGRFPR